MLPESFWTGWYTVMSILVVFTIVSAIIYGLPTRAIIGMLIGFTLFACITGFFGSLGYWAIGLGLGYLFIQSQLNWERIVYKWTNGRPDGER